MYAFAVVVAAMLTIGQQSQEIRELELPPVGASAVAGKSADKPASPQTTVTQAAPPDKNQQQAQPVAPPTKEAPDNSKKKSVPSQKSNGNKRIAAFWIILPGS